ncbi:hypothetical protein RB195_006582 [Necator americanus]|uniref:Uncharacterized protein n=1 Tax=Necator americanus TaxID=51031 RepID=A0ABR1BUS0_NECAM
MDRENHKHGSRCFEEDSKQISMTLACSDHRDRTANARISNLSCMLHFSRRAVPLCIPHRVQLTIQFTVGLDAETSDRGKQGKGECMTRAQPAISAK